jgi:hypothetical protein
MKTLFTHSRRAVEHAPISVAAQARALLDVRSINGGTCRSSHAFGYDNTMNDTSRRLRHELGELCERYNTMIADKDALDFRLGSPQPYGETVGNLDAGEAYLRESRSVSSDLRAVIVEMLDIGRRIREIEGF